MLEAKRQRQLEELHERLCRLVGRIRHLQQEGRAAVTLQCVCRRTIARWITCWIVCELAAIQIQRRVRGIQCRALLFQDACALEQQHWTWQFEDSNLDFDAEHGLDALAAGGPD